MHQTKTTKMMRSKIQYQNYASIRYETDQKKLETSFLLLLSLVSILLMLQKSFKTKMSLKWAKGFKGNSSTSIHLKS